MKKKHINKHKISNYEYEKKYSEKEIEKINLNILLKDIEQIYEQNINYVSFIVEKGHLKAKKMLLDKMTHMLQENDEIISLYEKKKKIQKNSYPKI